MERLVMKERINLEKLPFPEQMMSTMTDVLGDYCKANNLEYLSADDILHTYPNLTDDQREWLTTFGKMWDNIQELN